MAAKNAVHQSRLTMDRPYFSIRTLEGRLIIARRATIIPLIVIRGKDGDRPAGTGARRSGRRGSAEKCKVGGEFQQFSWNFKSVLNVETFYYYKLVFISRRTYISKIYSHNIQLTRELSIEKVNAYFGLRGRGTQLNLIMSIKAQQFF